jgi:uncharacterized membrane protein YkoI
MKGAPMNTSKLRSKRVVLSSGAAVAALGIGGVAWGATANADLADSERDRVGNAATEAVGGGTAVEVETSDDRGEAYEVEVRMDDGTEVDVALSKDLEAVVEQGDRDDDRDDGADDRDGDADDRDDGAEDRDDDRGDSPDADDRVLSGSERSAAEKAALEAVDGGTLIDVEASDDRGEAYEVDVRDSGNVEWDVELDAEFQVLGKTRDE